MKRPLVLALALLAVGCATPDRLVVPDGPVGAVTSTSASEVTTTVAPAYEVERCSSTPPREWTLLCQAYALVEEHHLDRIDPPALAAAAVSGLASHRVPEGGESPDRSDVPLRCVVPHETFETLCAAMVDRPASESIEGMVEAAVQGLFRFGLDPFSSYIPPDYAERLDELGGGLVLSLGMVTGARNDDGSVCGPLGGDCRFRVLAVEPFFAAERAGVLIGDIIENANGTPLVGLSQDEAIARLLGDPGEELILTIDRPSGPVEKRLVHEDIRFDPVEFDMISSQIAYLRLNDFSQLAAQLTGRVLALDEVRSASSLILDLRDNPGGLLLSAQAVASQFLDGGLVMTESGRDDEIEIPVVDGGLARSGIQVVILTNRGTASAAEIVAAVLQERGRATVIGDTTFGKNLVQRVFTARNGGEIRVTIARWATPEGLDIGIRGLEPDILVTDPVTETSDPALDRALSFVGG